LPKLSCANLIAYFENSCLSERMVGEGVCFWLFLFDLEGLTPLPTYPKEWDQNQVVHSQKLFGGLGWF